jgi:hypothetical protein
MSEGCVENGQNSDRHVRWSRVVVLAMAHEERDSVKSTESLVHVAVYQIFFVVQYHRVESRFQASKLQNFNPKLCVPRC